MSRIREKSQQLRLWREDQLPQSTNSTLSYDLPSSKDNKELSTFAKINWVIKDKDQFESLIRGISDLINDMDRVVPPQRNDDLACSVLKTEIQRLRNVCDLTKILHASTDDNNDLVDITKETIDRECTQLILGHLWFRLIDDRKDGISEAHSKTFEWALHPPTSDDTWSDLGQWLRSGRGIYWISGKPGSGKSTLMKFLYNHSEVAKALQDWTGDRKLTVASFLLWNLGSPEQNSQQGLAQGLLYHVLNQNRSLIPVILPHMWTEAQNGSVELEIPSSVEMQRAFQRLGTESTNGAYVFFIDGLDEFTGNHRDSISFVQSFASSANIKVSLSSRPIDTCVAAFSTKPKLRLQDLTESDMESYVNDIVRTHPYVADSPYLSVAVVDRLVDDLRSKADGVFLWVVLACRTLLEGFDAYDNAKELQRRVDELPPELSDLFRHILSGLPARSLQQTAKLLKVCYTSRLLQISDRISTFALAWADEKDLSTTTLEDFTRCSVVEMRANCQNLDGRLRSRCRGLLEVHHHRGKHSRTGSDEAETSPIDFMHRTVFEFLSTPRVWEMDCLQIHDSEFDAAMVLSCMSNYLLYLQEVPISQETELAAQSLAYVQHIYGTSPSQAPRSLNQLALALMEPRHKSMSVLDLDTPDLDSFDSDKVDINVVCHDDPGDKEEELFFGYSKTDLPLSYASLLLAVEADLMGHIREEDVCAFNVSQNHLGCPYKGINLLYHAIKKPPTQPDPDPIAIFAYHGRNSSNMGVIQTKVSSVIPQRPLGKHGQDLVTCRQNL
jgi:hypothetical protein